MKNKIKTLDGRLLTAILDGAKVFRYDKVNGKAFIVLERDKGFFLEPAPGVQTRYDYVLFMGEENRNSIKVVGYACGDEEMHEIFDEIIKALEMGKGKNRNK